eukprot:6174978-Pleurochrysis_carterae.AAC.1
MRQVHEHTLRVSQQLVSGAAHYSAKHADGVRTVGSRLSGAIEQGANEALVGRQERSVDDPIWL